MTAEEALRSQVALFSTCPQSAVSDRATYLESVLEVARWSERAGCRGILIYSDNQQVDPWVLSQVILQNTRSLCPLVAVQPVYMHPYSVAKMAATFGHLFRRRIYLNMVSGGFKNDLAALNDTTPHNDRYVRLTEYTAIIQQLLSDTGLTSYNGRYYKTENLRMTPPLDPDLMPGVFVSGSSEAGLEAARALSATAIHYPEPAGKFPVRAHDSIEHGIRIGIIAREREEQAWDVAHSYFPEDRKGQLLQQLAMKVSDSVWHQQLAASSESEDSLYWLVPFQNYKTFCPYLVGNYQRVAGELAMYLRAGVRTFILDIPKKEEDFNYINAAFRLAMEAYRCQSFCTTG